jgi:hypothetical protein
MTHRRSSPRGRPKPFSAVLIAGFDFTDALRRLYRVEKAGDLPTLDAAARHTLRVLKRLAGEVPRAEAAVHRLLKKHHQEAAS